MLLRLSGSGYLKKTLFFFLLALVIRFVLNIVFLGSSDFFLALALCREIVEGGFPYSTHLPYFPVMPIFFWGQWALAVVTGIPVTFWMKFVSSVFDALLAVLIFDLVDSKNHCAAFSNALLYVFSPIALMVICMHGQWDSLPHFFLLFSFYVRDYWPQGYARAFVFGCLFGFSFLLKPYTLIFVLFFLQRYKGSFVQELGKLLPVLMWGISGLFALIISCYVFFKLSGVSLKIFITLISELWLFVSFLFAVFIFFFFKTLRGISFSVSFKKYLFAQLVACIGLVAIVILFFTVFYLLGFDLLKTVDIVLRHFNQGVQHFGLPFAYPFNGSIFRLFLKNRFWLMGLISYFAYLYYQGKFDVYWGILLSFSTIFVFSGYLTTYFMWLLPLLLIVNEVKVAAFLNAVGGFLLLLVYTYPWSNAEIPFHNSLTLAHLKQFLFLQLPLFFQHKVWGYVIVVLGNYFIPLLSALLVIIFFYKVYNNRLQDIFVYQGREGATWYFYIACLVPIFFLGGYFMFNHEMLQMKCSGSNVLASFLDFYNITNEQTGKLSMVYGGHSLFNSANLFIVFVVVWSLIAWMCGVRGSNKTD